MTLLQPEVQLLAGVAASLVREFLPIGDDPWDGSPFAWIKREPSSRRKGAIAERLVAEYLGAKGFIIARCGDSEADRVVNGHRVEIKFSTPCAPGGFYKFQQICDQDYEYVICLGTSPFDAHCWVVPKAVLMANTGPQHGGKAGSDTQWLTVMPNKPEAWLAPFGGSLVQANTVMKKAFKNG